MFDRLMNVLTHRLLACLIFVAAPALAQEGVLSQLYAARPPAGASYVRVVNPLSNGLQIQIAQGPAQKIGGNTPASSYAIVQGGQWFPVRINGLEVARRQARADSFTTLVLQKEGRSYTFVPMDDTEDIPDALKAQLRFYNLVEESSGGGCPSAQLALSPSGALVLRDVAPNAAAARSVNPVKASLVGQCGAVSTSSVPLPTMQPGDHLSLFLVGPASAPSLRIQPTRTDAFKR